MNSRLLFGQKLRSLLWVGLLCLIAGCATKTDWAGRMGNYTFDQAILELGPPDKQATLQDHTVVAEWLTRRGYTQTHATPIIYPGPSSYAGPIGGDYTSTHVPDFYLRLTFGPDGKLSAWKKLAR